MTVTLTQLTASEKSRDENAILDALKCIIRIANSDEESFIAASDGIWNIISRNN